MKLLALSLVALVMTPAVAAAQPRLGTPTGRSNIAADAVAGINAMSTRPTPSSPGHRIVRPHSVWVPDRYVAAPGAPAGVHVPGHWERRVSDREVYVPPLVVVHPRGTPELIHGGIRPPAEERNSP